MLGRFTESTYTLTHRQQEVVCLTECGLSNHETSKPIPTMICFLQEDHTYSNKAKPPNSVIPNEFMGTIDILITTTGSPCLLLKSTKK